jgi:4-amino-4-deoxy-L-arabinose transferase-like glycosyltransferase
MSLDTQSPPRSRWFSILLPRPAPRDEPFWNPTATAWGPIVVLALLSAALFFHGLNIGDLYRTESLRAIIAAEFLRSGDWIVPRLYGTPLVTKPPGMYAAIAALSAPFGSVTEWTARLPSALGATAIVFLMYWYVSRHLGRLAGLVVAAVTPCGFLWIDKASAAETDMLQVAWTAASLLFFFRAVEETERSSEATRTSLPHPLTPSPPRALRFWLAALLCVAGGVFTKWTTPVFFYATAIPFLIWRRQFKQLFCWQHVLSAVVGASLCFAWVAAVVQQIGWDTFYQTIYVEAAPRLSYSKHLDSSSHLKALFHPLRLWLVNLPWSAFALFALWPGFLRLWDDRGRRLVQAFHCWAWPSLLVFSLLPDHTTRHSFPLFPGIVALGGMVWLAFVTGRLPVALANWHQRLAVAGLGLFGVAVLGGSVAGFVLLPSTAWWLLVIAALMGSWCVREGFRAYREHRLGGLLAAFVLTWVVCKFAYLHVYLPVRNVNREPRATAAVMAEHIPAGETLYVFGLKDEGIMFYYGRPVRRLKGLQDLPPGPQTVYCVVMEDEWNEVKERGNWQIDLELRLKDEQGDSMVLLGLRRDEPPIRNASPAPPVPGLGVASVTRDPCQPMLLCSPTAPRF